MIIYVLSCLLLITSVFTLIYLSTKKLRSVQETDQVIEVIEIVNLKPEKVAKKTKKVKKQKLVAKPEVLIKIQDIEEIKSEPEKNKVEVEEIVDFVEQVIRKKEEIPYKRRIKTPKKEIDDSINVVLDNKHEMLDFEIPKSIFNTNFSDIKHCVITQYHADNTSAYSRQIITEDDFLEVLSKIKRYSSQFVSGYKFSIMYDGIEEIFNLTTTIT